jgi:uncharacterized membrane protein YhaH (DUF805 family)
MGMLQELRPGRLFSPRGRRGRLSYFLTPFVIGIPIIVLVAVIGLGFGFGELQLVAPRAERSGGDFLVVATLLILFLAAGLATFWISIAVAVQRLHDLNRSGWLLLVVGLLGAAQGIAEAAGGEESLIALAFALAGFVFSLWLLLARGTPGPNRFGPAPTWPGGSTVAAMPSGGSAVAAGGGGHH